jgi:hypothetical protein
LKCAPLALIEYGKCFNEHPAADIYFVALSQDFFLTIVIADQQFLQLANASIFPNLRVKRNIAAETTVHIDDILFADTQTSSDCSGLTCCELTFIK